MCIHSNRAGLGIPLRSMVIRLQFTCAADRFLFFFWQNFTLFTVGVGYIYVDAKFHQNLYGKSKKIWRLRDCKTLGQYRHN